MKVQTRRSFLRATLVGGTAASIAPHTRVFGANDDVRVAVVGMNNQGKNHISYFSKLPGVRVAALCDVDRNVLDREVKRFTDRKETVSAYGDVRRLLEDPGVDAVVVATPNHWHALVTVWACQAGKDVYVEKPVSHNIREGRAMVEAARKYGRMVQAGTQRRSDDGLAEAFDYIRQGGLGKILRARCYYFSKRGPIGKVTGPQPIPPGVDYDLWLGPAPEAPLMRKRLHYDWHWQWPYGNGDLGNNGIHYIDVCRWALGYTAPAPRALSFGGEFLWDDDRQTPNTQVAYFDYAPAPIIFEMRNLTCKTGDSEMDLTYGKSRAPYVIECEGGYYAGGWVYDAKGERVKQFKETGGAGHHANFIKAVRSRKADDLNAEIHDGYCSTADCHIGNISYRLGKQTPHEQVAESFKASAVLADAFDRFRQHLAANGVNAEVTPGVAGPWLTFDAASARFVGEFAEPANAYLSRNYRVPFVVPETV